MLHPIIIWKFLLSQDSQEFLRCFMDQLHEELKQVVDTEMVDQEEDHADLPALEHATGKDLPEASVITATETNSQSDTDYETCDSGMSSERSSVENSHSADECGEDASGKPGQDQPRLRGRPGRGKRSSDKNRVNPESPGSDCVTSASGIRIETTKERSGKEDGALLLGRGDGVDVSSGAGVIDVDSGEFSDAVSELEPLQGQHFKSAPRSRGQSSETEAPSMQNHIPHGTNNVQGMSAILYRCRISHQINNVMGMSTILYRCHIPHGTNNVQGVSTILYRRLIPHETNNVHGMSTILY